MDRWSDLKRRCVKVWRWMMRHRALSMGCFIMLILLIAYWQALPDRLFDKPLSTLIEDRNGRMLGARIADDGQWRFPVSDSVPEKYLKALVAFEDKRFFYHPGVDPLAIGRATLQNLRSGKIVSGGSTITMQVIRLMQDNPPRSFWQKLREAVLATRLELRCSKHEILRLYAANAPFGGNVVGIDAAAWRYFGRSPDELSWAEAATLAVLPNTPALIHPGRNRTILFNKRNKLLDKLQAEGLLSAEACLLAKEEPLPDKPHPLPTDAPYLLDRMYASDKGQRVRTTVDAALQQWVNRTMLHYAAQYRGNYVNNMAVIVAEAESGDVLAYAGNVYRPQQPPEGFQVDVIRAARSTGSILKPFLYAAMLDHGELLPGSLVPDIPVQILNFAPKNFDRTYDGAVPAHRALERSLNVPAVRMLQTHGIEAFYHLLKRLGMTTLSFTPDHYGLTLILGGAEGTLWDITGMYATLSRTLKHFAERQGTYDPADIHALNCTLSQSTTLLKEPSNRMFETSAPIEAAAIWQTFQSLSNLNRPEEEAGWKNFSSSQKIAWKTGTSYGFRDAWAVGVNQRYVVGVWVGNASGEGRPMLTGVGYAAPVLFDVFSHLPDGPWFTPPYDDLTPAVVCRQSGYRASPICPDRDTILIAARGVETEECPFHILVHLDKTERYRVTSDCVPVAEMVHRPWFVLPAAQEWFYKQKNIDYKPLPPIAPGCQAVELQQQMALIYPQPDLTVVLPRQLDGTEGQAVFRATHRRSKATIFWHIDGRYAGSTRSPHRIALAPPSGNHTLTLVDDKGNRLVTRFRVE